MTRHLSCLLSVAFLTALVAACSQPNLRPQDKSPAIGTLKSKQPDKNKLAIVLSDPVAPDPEKALENYRAILELPSDDTVRQEAMRRMADLQVQTDDASGGGDSSEKLLADSILTYQQLLRESPNDPRNDRVLYQLARAQQNSGKPEEAIATLTTLTTDYPTSRLNGDAHFRRAELLFRLGNYADAEREYKFVMDLNGATPFFEPAQYKYGWSLFKQSRFDDALPVFFAILDRELPPGELKDVDAALSAVNKGKADLAKDSLRVTSLAFSVMGAGPAVNQYFTAHPEPRFYPLVYNALGEMLLDKRRFSDAAGAYAAFIERHPQHPAAPQFQARVIDVYKEGGFNDQVVREKERYVNTYAPGTTYWAGATPTPEVLTALRGHLEDLARHYQALAQQGEKVPQVNQAEVHAAFLASAGWYRRILEIYPQDPKAPEINYLLAEALEDGGQPLDAANEFSKTAYGYPMHARSLDAGYAAVLAYHKNAESQPAAGHPAALKLAIAASIKLADEFPTHPEAVTALTRAAQDLYELKDPAAVTVAQRVLAYNPAPSPQQRRIVQGVLGDSYFAQGDFARAEVAYADLLKLTPGNDPQHAQVVEQLAASIYKQAEAARTAGNLRAAADGFLRVGQVTPDAAIRQTADYDAGAALIGLNAWGEAATVLEGFRSRYPTSPLLTDVDKKLAIAYVKDNKPLQAADAYRRIAARPGEAADVRQDAAWQAAKLFDDANRLPDAAKAYEFYVGAFPQPLDRAIDARRRIADIDKGQGDGYRYLFWLRELITADEAAGRNRTEHSKAVAAQAALDVGRITAQDAARIKITAPIEASLPQRKGAVEAAIQALEKAAAYGYADITTAATYELGAVYQSFAKALLDSERPRSLKGEEIEQYNVLLEEQALPFEDKAIAAHEANLKRVGQGLYDESIGQSVTALGVLSPAKYGNAKWEVTVMTASSKALLALCATLALAACNQSSVKPDRPEPAVSEAGGTTKSEPAAVAKDPNTQFENALAAMKAKKLPEARAGFEALARQHPEFSGPLTNLGILDAKVNQRAAAIGEFTKALAANPRNAVAANWLGILYRENKNYDRAEQSYLQSLAINPDNAAVVLNLAILYDLYLNRPADALSRYRDYQRMTSNRELKVAAWIKALEAREAPAPASATPATTPKT